MKTLVELLVMISIIVGVGYTASQSFVSAAEVEAVIRGGK